MRLPTRILRTIAATAAVALLAVAIIACGDDDDDDDDGAYRAAPAATQAAAAEEAAAATEAAATAAPSRARPVREAAATEAASDSSSSRPQEVQAADSDEPAQPQRASPPDTDFKNYGRTPYVDTSEDAVSTFSLDTDRTSYFLALNWVQNGYVVEPDSVRAEEWINAFSYGYDLPRRDDSFAITSDVLEHPLGGGRHLARIAFQAPKVRDDIPLNVTLVLDASGSMADGNRVAIARAAAEAIPREPHLTRPHRRRALHHRGHPGPDGGAQPARRRRRCLVDQPAHPEQLHERAGRAQPRRAARGRGSP